MTATERFVLFMMDPNPHTEDALRAHVPIRRLDDRTPGALVVAASGASTVVAKSSGLGFTIDADLMERLPTVELLAAPGSGADCFDEVAATAAGIPVIHNPGVGARAVAEYVLAVLPLLAKNLWRHHEQLREGVPFHRTAGRLEGGEVFGKTLGIVGFGAIGREVAVRAIAGYGVSVAVFDPAVDDEPIGAAGCHRAESLLDLLAQADFVSLHVPASADTRRLIGAAELAAMRSGAFLVNTARGAVVDEVALAAALDSGRLAGAALDVFDQEPPESSNPLLAHPKVFATPHLAGISKENRVALGLAAADAILLALRGDRPPNLVNPQVWGSSRHVRRQQSAAMFFKEGEEI